MKWIILSFLLLINTFLANSQDILLTIIDSITHKPLAYSSLIFLDDNVGNYSNEEGVFTSNKIGHRLRISQISYNSKEIVVPKSDCIVMLQPKPYSLDEVTIKPSDTKPSQVGFFNKKQEFTVTGLTGDEMAVFIPNPFNNERYLKELLIKTDASRIIKSSLNIDFVSVFRVNFYLKKPNSLEPDNLQQIRSLICSSKILKKNTAINISNLNILLPTAGIFVSIEWIGIEYKNSKDLITDYKFRTEPFISTTLEQTNTVVFFRNKFLNDTWKLVDKNNPYSQLFKKDNFYTPCISLMIY